MLKNKLQNDTGIYLTSSQFGELMESAGYTLSGKTGTYDVV